MKRLTTFLLFLVLLPVAISAQNLVVQGRVSDMVTDESLEFCTVILDKKNTASTDTGGFFRLKTQPGRHTLKISRVGYRVYEVTFEQDEPGIKNFKIELEPFENTLDQVVVAGSRENKKVSREVTTINIIKPYLIENTNSTDLSQVVNRIPGVQVVDGQATIRGGVGFSYNTGSRVAVLLDDMPLLGADYGDARWKFLPIEAAEQIEVIKGSASVLYGSSALNGTINLRTGWPGRKPQTKIQAYQGIMQNFERKVINWWEPSTQPFNNGIMFSYKQAFGPFDLVWAGNVSSQRSHLQYGDEFRARTYIKTRYRPKGNPNMSFGINGCMMYEKSGHFFLWNDGDTGALKQLNGIKPLDELFVITTIDPHFDYKHGHFNHAVKGRFYQIHRIVDKTRFPGYADPMANLYTFDYSNRYKAPRLFAATSGIYATALWAQGSVYKGEFAGASFAAYTQPELNIGRFNVVLGARYEVMNVGTTIYNTGLLKRFGVNYAAAAKTFLRFNYSEGYRVPTIAERFVEDNVSFLYVLPNPDLQPERGWTAEVGLQQGFRIRNFVASADVALFVQQYQRMIEFTFNEWVRAQVLVDSLGNVTVIQSKQGFKAINIGDTRAGGFELSVTGEGKIGDVMIRTIAGYTYALPVNMSADNRLEGVAYYLDQFATSMGIAKIDSGTYLRNILLPYRNRGTGKIDLELTYSKFSFGYGMFYYSVYEKVDEFVLTLPGVKSFFNRAGNADIIHNLRFSYQPVKNASVGFLVNNAGNREYATRPGKMDAARTFVLQLRMSF